VAEEEPDEGRPDGTAHEGAIGRFDQAGLDQIGRADSARRFEELKQKTRSPSEDDTAPGAA
jgi:hypothetical protein